MIEPSRHNIERLFYALIVDGLGTAELTTPEAILANEIAVFDDRVRADVRTSAPGLDFATAWRNKQSMQYGGSQFYVASRSDLISSKIGTGREIDLAGIRSLETDSE